MSVPSLFPRYTEMEITWGLLTSVLATEALCPPQSLSGHFKPPYVCFRAALYLTPFHAMVFSVIHMFLLLNSVIDSQEKERLFLQCSVPRLWCAACVPHLSAWYVGEWKSFCQGGSKPWKQDLFICCYIANIYAASALIFSLLHTTWCI